MLNAFSIWTQQNATALLLIASISFVLLLATVLATPFLLARMPANYFARTPQQSTRTPLRVLIAIVRTVLGVVLIMTGILMIFTPGPGLVALVLGLSLCDFPGKHRLLQRLVSHPSVFNALNWVRARADKPPFLQP